MLLHKLYINVPIADSLLYRFSLYDLPGPKFKNRRFFGKRFLANISPCVDFRLNVAYIMLYINMTATNILLHSFSL